MEKNYCIKCDVTRCKHHSSGNYCGLSSIKVTCGGGDSCTCCGDYAEV